MEQCEEERKTFFGLYKGLLPWHAAYVEFAVEHGHVRSPLGRIRHLPLIKSRDRAIRNRAARQAINSPVQSTLSDLCLWSIARAEMVEELDRQGLEIGPSRRTACS